MTPSIRGFLRPVLVAHRRRVAALAAWSVVETVPILGSGLVIAAALDHGFLAGKASTGVLLLLLYGATLVVGTLGTRQAMPHTAVIVESVRDELVRLVVRTHLRHSVYHGPAPDTATVSRITRQAETVRQIMAGLLMTVRAVVFGVTAAIVGLFSLDPWLALVAIPAVALAGVLLAVLSRVLRRRYRTLLDAQEALAQQAGAPLGGIRDVVTCGAWHTAGARIGRFIDAEADALTATARAGAGRIAVITVGARLPFLLILVASPWLVSRQLLSPGSLVGAMTYLLQGLEPALRALVQTVGNMGLQFVVTLRRLIGSAVEPMASSGGMPVHGTEIALRDVTFCYGPHARPVFSDVNLEIPVGEHVAVVGPSGIGKSTLALLVAGVEQPSQGKVTLGGTPVSELDDTALREQVAFVPQEAYVFRGSVRENLAYLHPGVSDAELDTAVLAVGLVDTVDALGGYDGVIENPAALSQGERQLITLARVHASRASVVILDEATCHLDSASEVRAEEAFATRPGTLIVIAHRISSAMRADRVFLMGENTLVQGTHEELLRCSPAYAGLVDYWYRAGGAVVGHR